jgi:hypothetical protein
MVFDIETDDFGVDETVIGSTDWLYERHPDAQSWGIRIGCRSDYYFGARNLK